MSNVDHSDQLPTVLSLCTGYGGIERGLSLAGFEHRTVAHVEIEAFAAAHLVAKMEEGQLVPAPIYTDLKTLPAHCFRERIDVLTGGYPCQPFSAAGLRKGADDPRHLWPFIRRHIETIRPVRCFFENVEGHISLGLREVIADLESLGYQTAWGIFSAAGVGAPHQRKRVYILAHANFQRLQRRVQRGRADEEGRQEQKVRPSTKRGDQRPGHGRGSGSPVSGLGRGFDGPASWMDGTWEVGIERVISSQKHRVDRLRLLGNGVVPDTAAKAWIVLNDQLASE